MYLTKGYCAGILIFSENAQETELQNFLKEKEYLLIQGELTIQFGMGVVQTATELCIDVYEKASGQYRLDLSTSYKLKK